LPSIRRRRADRSGQDSWRWEAALASQARLAEERNTKHEQRCQGSGKEREHRTPPRRASGSLSGPEYRWLGARSSRPGRGGPTGPGPHCRDGAAGPHGFLEGPLGATAGSPTVSMTLQRSAPQARLSPERVCHHVLHGIDRDVLRDASRQTRTTSAPGGRRCRPRRLPSTSRPPSGICTRGGVTLARWRRPSRGWGARQTRGRSGRSANPAARTSVSSARW
jgi:hypothetical protein